MVQFVNSSPGSSAAATAVVVGSVTALIPSLTRILSSIPVRRVVVEIELVPRDGRIVRLASSPVVHPELVSGRFVLQHLQFILDSLNCGVLLSVPSPATSSGLTSTVLCAAQGCNLYSRLWFGIHFVVVHILGKSN